MAIACLEAGGFGVMRGSLSGGVRCVSACTREGADGWLVKCVGCLQAQKQCVVMLWSSKDCSKVFEVWHGKCRPVVYSMEPDLRTPDLRVRVIWNIVAMLHNNSYIAMEQSQIVFGVL